MRLFRLLITKSLAIIAYVMLALFAWLIITAIVLLIANWALESHTTPGESDFGVHLGFGLLWFFVSIPLMGILIIIFYEWHQYMIGKRKSRSNYDDLLR